MFVVGIIPFHASAASFKDVPRDHWAYDDIQFLTQKSIIKGFSNDTFQPLKTLTRKDAAVMIIRALKLPVPSKPQMVPTDLKSSMSGYREMVAATEKGMFTLSGKSFKPNSSLTRKEMAKILAVAYAYKGAGQSHFSDISSKHPYYKYIDALDENGITSGYKDGSFKPDVAVNRAQFSTFLARVYAEPLEYSIKVNGKILKKVRNKDDAIQLALANPNSTVHPVSNSVMSYGQLPASMDSTGIHNGVFVYNGDENRSFNKDYFMPYLKNDKGNLFDSFVMLSRTYKGGEFAETPKNKANYSDWQWYSNQTFAGDGAFTGLNSAAKETGRKVNVYLAIPYPKRSEAIITLDGKKVVNSLTEREKLVSWYISQTQAKWKKSNFSNLTFKGYYWLNETVIQYEDELLVEKTSAILHAQNKKFIYAPHALTTNFANWKSYGFDGAYLQPNAFRLGMSDTEARLHKAFLNAQIQGSGITLEIDSYSPHQMDAGLTNFRLYLNYAHRYQLKGQSFLFYQGNDMVRRMANYSQPSYQSAYSELAALLQ